MTWHLLLGHLVLLSSGQRFYFSTCPQGQEQSQFYLVDRLWQLHWWQTMDRVAYWHSSATKPKECCGAETEGGLPQHSQHLDLL